MSYATIQLKCSKCKKDIFVRKDRYIKENEYFCYTCIPEKYHLKCSCGKYFGSNSPSVKFCPECRENQYSIVNCFRCGKKLKILKKQIIGKNVCKRCNSIINGQKALIAYNTSEKGRNKSAEIGRRTIKIAQKYQVQNNKIRFCDKCGKETMHLSGIGCMKCHNNSKVMVNATIQRNLYNWKNDPEYRKRIATNLKDYIKEPNFQYKDNVLFYKGMEWNNFCLRLSSGELNPNDYPGIENRLGVWTYNRIDPLSNEPILLNKDFILRDNVLFYKNTPWEEYKLSFIVKPQLSVEQLSKELNGFIQPTFRSQESLYWENRSAFEKDLIDKNIGWFVYIKFYIDRLNKESKPLVVGKTGTKLVSNSNTDISFDYEENYDGCQRPARIFLKETNTDWNKTYILIIPCDTELKALQLEKEIGESFNLFYM